MLYWRRHKKRRVDFSLLWPPLTFKRVGEMEIKKKKRRAHTVPDPVMNLRLYKSKEKETIGIGDVQNELAFFFDFFFIYCRQYKLKTIGHKNYIRIIRKRFIPPNICCGAIKNYQPTYCRWGKKKIKFWPGARFKSFAKSLAGENDKNPIFFGAERIKTENLHQHYTRQRLWCQGTRAKKLQKHQPKRR